MEEWFWMVYKCLRVCWGWFLLLCRWFVFLSAGSAHHHCLDLADAFDLAEFGFEFVYDACFVFGEFYLNEKGN